MAGFPQHVWTQPYIQCASTHLTCAVHALYRTPRPRFKSRKKRPLEVRPSIHLGTPVTLARAARPAEKPGRDSCATGTKIPALDAQTVLAHYVDMPLSVCSAGCWLWLSLTSPPSPREKLLSAAPPSASGLGSGTCQRPRFNKLLVGNLPDSHRF